jgi:hypothetical protein
VVKNTFLYHGDSCKALANGMVGMPEASQMGGMGGGSVGGGSMSGRQMGGAGASAPGGVPQQIPGAQLLFAVGGLQRANSPLWTAEVYEAEHGGWRQGLTLVHYLAQLEPFLTQKQTLNTPNTPYHPLNTPEITPSLYPLSHRRRLS